MRRPQAERAAPRPKQTNRHTNTDVITNISKSSNGGGKRRLESRVQNPAKTADFHSPLQSKIAQHAIRQTSFDRKLNRQYPAGVLPARSQHPIPTLRKSKVSKKDRRSKVQKATSPYLTPPLPYRYPSFLMFAENQKVTALLKRR